MITTALCPTCNQILEYEAEDAENGLKCPMCFTEFHIAHTSIASKPEPEPAPAPTPPVMPVVKELSKLQKLRAKTNYPKLRTFATFQFNLSIVIGIPWIFFGGFSALASGGGFFLVVFTAASMMFGAWMTKQIFGLGMDIADAIICISDPQ
jgi:hypothetical protein